MTRKQILEAVRALPYPERKQLLHDIIDTLGEAKTEIPSERVPGLHAGTTWMSDDFDAPLPDEFWLGDE
ncbi:MAG: DUF2281 domain-containing protein [Chloroflexota bacterium]